MAISLDDLSRKLPIGVQSFEDLRNNNCLYVDKTDYVYYVAHSGTKSYFLARPRRFGKSLFANTLRAYFEGKKDCFEGLKICEYEKDWTKYPILYFDFVDGDYTEGVHILRDKLSSTLEDFEKSYGITCEKNTLPERFKADLTLVYEKTGLKTVIIVDEYDNPLIKSNDLESSKDIYRSFFAVLKSTDNYIRFAFFTGVTKFAKTSIFSGQNQPEDITDDENFSAICGITHEELIGNFTPEIEKLAKKQGLTFDECIAELKRWYDSYLFHEDGEKVFNPVSLLNVFKKRDFQNYWYDTGNPEMLMKRIHSTYYDFKRFENDVEYPKDDLKIFKNVEHDMDLVQLLYYTGYLTIKSYDRKTRTYILGFPNNEIKLSFLQGLINEFYRAPDSLTGFIYADFLRDFRRGDVESLVGRFQALYSTIPYANDNNDKWVERDFQNVIFLVFTICGQFVIAEPHFSKGRADTIVIDDNYVYLFEFKMDSDAQTALSQINEKDYAGRFKMDGRKLLKVGVSFSSKEKNIVDWKVAE